MSVFPVFLFLLIHLFTLFCSKNVMARKKTSQNNKIYTGFLHDCMCTLRKLKSASVSAQSDHIFLRVFLSCQGSKVSSGGQRILLSDCADAQADL